MVFSNRLQGEEQVLVPAGCPQNPEGGYDLIAGARRELLLGKMNTALAVFQKSGEVEALLAAIETLVVNGLAVADLNHVETSDASGNLAIACREIISGDGAPRIEITVVDNDRRYLVEVEKAQISPSKSFQIRSCPLVGKEEQPGCNPESCQTVLAAKDKTGTRN